MIKVHLASGSPSGFGGLLDFEKGVDWDFSSNTFIITDADDERIMEIPEQYVFFVERIEENGDA